VVESQDSTRVLVNGGGVVVFRLLCGAASRIARVEVPEGQVLSTDVGGVDDHLVEVAVWRAHPSGLNTNDTLKSQFNAPHFVMDLIPCESSQVFVGPCVRTKLVTLRIDLLDLRLVVVDTSPVVAVDEESSLSTGIAEGVADGGHVVVWPVIEGEGNRIWNSTGVEGSSSPLEESRYSGVGRFRFGYGVSKGGGGKSKENRE